MASCPTITSMLRLFLMAAALAVLCVSGKENLFAYVDEALESAVFDKLGTECLAVHSWATDPSANSGLMHGKRPTFWYDLSAHRPRNLIEAAVLRLRTLIPATMLGNSTVRGAEWWVQVRSKEEGITFHYDKDEGLASIKGIMKHPAVSTVTYLSDIGAPTLIFEMITIDGNQEVPEIPDAGFLSYPRKNRHIMFSGDLQHGVLGSAAPRLAEAGNRVTLLINWWSDPPIEPNTVVLTDDLARENKHLRTLVSEDFVAPPLETRAVEVEVEAPSGGFSSSSGIVYAPTQTLEIPPVSSGLAVRHTVTFPPGDLHFLYLPANVPPGQVYEVKWADDQCYGSLGLLDLLHSNQVNQLFRLPQPKLLLMYESLDNNNLYEAILTAVLPLAKKMQGHIKVYLCPTSSCANALEAFGLTRGDLPRAVIDDTKAQKKHVQKKGSWQPTTAALESFIHSSLPNLQGIF